MGAVRRSLRSSRCARACTASGSAAAVDLGLELRQIVTVVLAELARDRAELLLQVELALILEQRSPHVLVDLALQSQELDLGTEQLCQCLPELGKSGRLQQLLPDLVLDRQVRGDGDRAALVGLDRLDESGCLVGDAAVERDVLLEPRQHLADYGRAIVVGRHARLGSQSRCHRRGDGWRRPQGPSVAGGSPAERRLLRQRLMGPAPVVVKRRRARSWRAGSRPLASYSV